MQPGTVAPVNLYLQPSSPPDLTLYKTAQTLLSDETRQRLMVRGVPNLYVRKQDEDAYYDYVEDHIVEILKDELLPAGQACEIVYTSSSRVMGDVFDDPRSGRNVQRAHRMVEGMVCSILTHHEALWLMTTVASHDYHTYTHSVDVCMFLVSACRDVLGIKDGHMLEKVGLGGIFHDVGKSEIPEAILTKPGKLTPEEFEVIKKHPARGLEILGSRRDVSAEAASIIVSHHEHFDGTGYPGGMSGKSISKLARLATVIDVYDALTTERPYAHASNPYDALQLMLQGMDGHFDRHLLRSFVKFLGPRAGRIKPLPEVQKPRAAREVTDKVGSGTV
jgi:putative nucleotidyltransferase with HDIG domain